MSLKTVFSTLKKEGYVVPVLEKYLTNLNDTDGDRAIDVNAPSQAGTCLRSRFYARTHTSKDVFCIDSRARRILDNGTFTHIRLQEYLLKQGILLLDEVPVINDEYNIQGHTDGILKLSSKERGVLEIKSINDKGFTSLHDAKDAHKRQGLIYICCLEDRRTYLKNKYKTEESFNNSLKERQKEASSHYQHLTDGSKYTREEKIAHQILLHEKMDDILFHTDLPITKAVFLYENKDNQDLKEFTITMQSAEAKNILKEVLDDYSNLNACIASNKIPNREGTSKSCSVCRWCDYKLECWN